MENTIALTAIINKEVVISEGCIVQDFVIIGVGNPDSSIYPISNIGKNAVIRSHSVIYFGNQIGDFFQTGHGVLIREKNKIGDYVSIGSHSTIEHNISIGSRTRIHSNVFIPEFSIIDEDVWIGPNVVFTNAMYPANPNTKLNLIGPHILPFSRIGANSTILPGIVIGKNTLIGAGSVVTHNVPDGKVVVGNPARIIRDISDLSEYDFISLLNK